MVVGHGPASAVLYLLAAVPGPAAVELELHYTVLEKVLAQQVFTQEGRKYVRGSKDTKCSFAYLENPKLGGENGQIRLNARFSGRSALDVFGRCIGLGDSFDLSILATPVYKDGRLLLSNVRISTAARQTYYVRRVIQALTEDLPKTFQYPIADDARRILQQSRDPAYRQELSRFNVSAIQVTPVSLVLTLDFRLVVE